MDLSKLENEQILYLYLSHKNVVEYYDKMIKEKYSITTVGFGMTAVIPIEDRDIIEIQNSVSYKISLSIVKTLYSIAELIGSVEDYKYILEFFKVNEVTKYNPE